MNLLVDFLFPKRCVACKRIGSYICSECLNKLSMAEGRVRLTAIDGLCAPYRYKALVKEIVRSYKYRFVEELVEEMVELMAGTGELELIKNCDFLTAVPLHQRRFNWRGFNQAQELAKRLALYMNKPYCDALVRLRYTKPQMELSGKERRENLKGAFGLVPGVTERGKRIALVDDVWTTGSTMEECAAVLKRAVAKKVWGVVFARA